MLDLHAISSSKSSISIEKVQKSPEQSPEKQTSDDSTKESSINDFYENLVQNLTLWTNDQSIKEKLKKELMV